MRRIRRAPLLAVSATGSRSVSASGRRRPACGGNPMNPNHIAGQEDLKEGFALHCSRPLQVIDSKRRDVRVVEGARLESVCTGNCTEGSNPSLSATTKSLNIFDLYSWVST